MPTYESQCQECGKDFDYYAAFKDYNTAMPECCGVQSKKVIRTTPIGYMQGDLAYKCPVTDKIVTNQRQRANIEAEHEITVVEKGMFKRKPKEKPPELPDDLKPHLQPALDQLARGI